MLAIIAAVLGRRADRARVARTNGRRYGGQAAVEFALSALAIALLLFGVLDLGRGVLQRQDLTNAVREGARYAALDSTARAQDAGSFATLVAASAAQHAPSLALGATNFEAAGGGSITCAAGATSARPAAPGAALARPAAWAGLGLLALGPLVVAKQPTPTPAATATPTTGPAPTAVGGGVSWTTEACSAARPGDRLTACAGYTFTPVAARLLPIGPVAMTACAAVTIQ